MSLAFDKNTVVKEYKDEIESLEKDKDMIAKKLGETIRHLSKNPTLEG